jgi:thiamine biosynthesis lipoprotein
MKTTPRYILIIFIIVAVFFGIFYLQSLYHAEKTVYLMGTPVKIKVEGANASRLAEAAIQEIRRLEKLFSKFDPKSEVSLINRRAGKTAVVVSDETFECIKIANEISGLSQGAFDITLGHFKELNIDYRRREVRINLEGIEIDLGGVGKGYAAEAASRLLLKKGAKSGMIDIRSSIAVFGPKVWRIGIQHPREKDKFLGTVTLKAEQSLSTSGDYERGLHILDPRRGVPAELCQSVTVIGKNMAETDALSTAVFVLGPKQGMQLIESLPATEVLIVDRQGKIFRSSGFILEK